MLTNIYPTLDSNYPGTKVCHFFTSEWKKMGYDVRVIHYDSLFPKVYYIIAGFMRNTIMAKTGAVVDLNTPDKAMFYEVEGIKVLRVTLKKYVPHGKFSTKSIQKALSETLDFLYGESYTPDVITAHFVSPQLEFLHLLKQHFPNSKTCMVLHSGGENLPHYYTNYETYMHSVDVWGFRSEAFKTAFENLYGIKPKEFLCYSGIPASYLSSEPKEFRDIKRFVFVGSLYKLKRVNDTIDALNEAFVDEKFSFDIVGDGSELDNLKQQVAELKRTNCVCFHGKKTRDEAQQILKDADCFIMVSSREAFGLVYVEAMAKGLIVIGTKGQGIDGVIKDGINGFLCESCNSAELAKTIKRVRNLSARELSGISQNAICTARNLTNEKVAKHYIESIIS